MAASCIYSSQAARRSNYLGIYSLALGSASTLVLQPQNKSLSTAGLWANLKEKNDKEVTNSGSMGCDISCYIACYIACYISAVN
jgi:hypothetical protein